MIFFLSAGFVFGRGDSSALSFDWRTPKALGLRPIKGGFLASERDAFWAMLRCAPCCSMISQMGRISKGEMALLSGPRLSDCPHALGLAHPLQRPLSAVFEAHAGGSASERTVSETSTSPGAEKPLMREAMLTAPP